MTALYSQQEDGSIQVIAGRKAWGVDIPAYAYDIWMPLIGLRVLSVYGLLWRLARIVETGSNKKTHGMGLKKLARAARMGSDQLEEAIAILEECKWIKVNVGDTYTANSYEILDIPPEVSVELIEKYKLSSGYFPVTWWLVERPQKEVSLNGDTLSPNGDSIIDPFLDPSFANQIQPDKPSASVERFGAGGIRKPKNGFTPLPAPDNTVSKLAIDVEAIKPRTLVIYVAEKMNVTEYKLTPRTIEALKKKPKVTEHGKPTLTYSSPLDLYDTDPDFQRFVRDRLVILSRISVLTLDKVLAHLCNFGQERIPRTKDDSGKNPGYHFWLKENLATGRLDPAKNKPAVAVPIRDDQVSPFDV